VVTLAISDVPGDDPAVIASGPTVPDETTCAEALAILTRYRIPLPERVKIALNRGDLETPKPLTAEAAKPLVHLLATPLQSLQAAAEQARTAGLAVHLLGDAIEGESREVGRMHAAMARAIAQGRSSLQRPCVLLSGGETTVTVTANIPTDQRGRGGRAGEFCMGVAEALHGEPHVWALAADTDGIDGVEDNAGATVSPDTLTRARALGLSLADHQQRNDAYGFFAALDDLVVTGPTHTNVNDFRALLVL
jgi:hydroxypyruvate reductase